MFKSGFVLNVALASALVAAACSGDEGTGASVPPDGAAAGGAGTGGRSAGGGPTGGGSPMGGGGMMMGTGGKASTGGAKATGGRDAASSAGGTSGDSGVPDGSDASMNPDGSRTDSGRDGAPEAAAPGCPSAGKYSFTFSGAGCGDLSSSAPSQRYDGFNCSGRFEYDNGGGKGVTGSSVTFATDGGALSASPLDVGSATMSCSGHATASTVSLDCSGEAGTCSIQMTRTGPL